MKHIKLFEEFAPKEGDDVTAWDIPSSKNCAIKDVTFHYTEEETTVKVVDNGEMIMPGMIGDVTVDDKNNGGHYFNLKRHWLDQSLGNAIVNYLDVNSRVFIKPEVIKVVLRPEGVKKNIELEYSLKNGEYVLDKRRFLSLR